MVMDKENTAVLDKKPAEEAEVILPGENKEKTETEEKPAEPPKGKELEKKNFPPEEGKRWNEMWHENQLLKQKDIDRGKDIEDMREQYKNLSDSVNRVEDSQYSDSKKPDIESDPGGHAEFMYQKGIHEGRRENKVIVTEKKVDTPSNGAKSFDIEERMMRTIHGDYDEIINAVNVDTQNDPVLRQEIYQSANPPKTAYEYGMKRKESAAKKKKELLDQGFVDNGSIVNSESDNSEITQLTDRQKGISKNLGIDEKQMIKNLNYQNKRIGRSN